MSGRRKTMVAGGSRPNSDINVTPLVDVVLVLLIIFMVVTPLLEKDIEVRVPDKEETITQDEPPPDQLVVQISEAGVISINTHPVTADDYVKDLHTLLMSKKSDERLVFFMADDKANYGQLVQALDGAKQAGAETLGMMTDPIEPPAVPPPAPPAP